MSGLTLSDFSNCLLDLLQFKSGPSFCDSQYFVPKPITSSFVHFAFVDVDIKATFTASDKFVIATAIQVFVCMHRIVIAA